MKPIPPISKYMTTNPMTIEKDKSLLEAAMLMKEHDIRHLPAVYNGKLEGILSATDVNLIRTIKGADIEKLKVMDCYTPNPTTVHSATLLDEVMEIMGNDKLGCVPVIDNDHLVGIFTWIDALKACAELLHTRLQK
jgi:acetoin utilization protein AcuB